MQPAHNKVLIILISMFFLSCSFNRRKLSPEEMKCQDGKQQAQTDIKNGKIVYCNFIDPRLQPLRYKDEMSDLMRKQHIGVQDFRIYEQTGNCYCQSMEDEIGKRFGNHFIDSVKQMSDSVFLIKHINDTIDPADCDTPPAYPENIGAESDHEIFQSRFDARVKYPKGYKYRNDSASLDIIYVRFVVEKTGEIKITGFNQIIRNTTNKQFAEYLEDQIRNILPHSGWKPATILNHPVNSNTGISVYLK